MSDQKHEHGSMSTDVQEKTFANFMKLVSKSTVLIVVALMLGEDTVGFSSFHL